MNWIIVTIFGAFFQNLRSSLQKKLNKDLSTVASTYVRFVFALPFASLLFFLYFKNLEIINEITKLNNLLKSGVLTQEEFEKAKKKILDN